MSTPSAVTSRDGVRLLHGLRILRNRRRVIFSCFALVFAAAGLASFLMPRQYEARVLFDLYRPDDGAALFADHGGSRPVDTDAHLHAARSKKVLQNVVAELGLAARWQLESEEEAYQRLRDSLQIDRDPSSEHLMIEASDPDPQLAADIANTVAGHFRLHLQKKEETRTGQALAALRTKLDHQQKKVQLARLEMDKAILGQGLNALVPVTGRNGKLTPESGEDAKVQEARGQVEAITAQMDQLKDLELNEFLQKAAALKLTDSFVENLLPKYHGLKLQLDSLTASGLGENHPRVTTVRTQIAQTEQMLQSSAVSIRDYLQMKLNLAREQLAQAEQTPPPAPAPSAAAPEPVAFAAMQVSYEQELGLLQSLQDEFSTGEIAAVLAQTGVEIQESATAPKEPSSPNVILNLLLGAFFGIAAGVGIAFLLEYLDTSLKSVSDVEDFVQLPVLGVVPRKVGVLHQLRGFSPDVEAYRILRTNLELNPERGDKNLISVVSGGEGEGKSTTVINLAYVCAQSGYNILLIDADLRRPRLHTFFGVENERGLTHYLTSNAMLEEVAIETAVENLFLLPSGLLPSDPAGVLNSQRMSELLADVKSRFDLILVDSPPILGVSDASILASAVDLSLIVVQHRRLDRHLIRRVKQAVEAAGGKALGVVLNNVDLSSDPQFRFFTSYHSYFSPSQKVAPATPLPPKPLVEGPLPQE